MIEIIFEYVAIWAPSLVAVLGVVISVLTAISKTKSAINEFKDDESVKELTVKIDKLSSENEELVRTNKLLLDQITKIKGFADSKKGE